MKIRIIASGSSGNCLLLSSGETHILIDAGVSMRRTDAALRQSGLTFGDIAGVLITHEHSDHVSGLKMISKHHGLPIYAPRTVANRLRCAVPETEEYINIIVPGIAFALGALSVLAFHTPHDTDESVGYRIEGDGSFALATDMGHVTDEILESLSGAHTVLIESNHDVDMLSYGPYPVYLKRRILSDRGHLSNADCARLAKELGRRGTRQIILGHLSRENNRPDKALEIVCSALDGQSIQLHCAPPEGGLCLSVGRTDT